MSKAFTKESDASDFMAPPRPPLPSGTKNYITRQGAERVQATLDLLLERKRRLTGSGLDSELHPIDLRIQHLQLLIGSFVVIEPAASDSVRFGSEVTLRRGSDEETYTIVGVDEIDLDQNRISWLSPLARAITGKRVGDRVRFQSPAGNEELEIVALR